jgi:WD40 repeat protein
MRCLRLLPQLLLLLVFGPLTGAALSQEAKEKAKLPYRVGALPVAAFSPDGKLLAVGHEESDGAPVIVLWDVTTSKPRGFLKGHKDHVIINGLKSSGGVAALAFTPDGKTLASGAGDRTIKLWDLAKGKERATIPTNGKGKTSGLAFSADGKILAANTGLLNDFEARVWDVAKGKEVAKFTDQSLCPQIGLTPDGKSVAWYVSGKVKLADVESGKEVRAMEHRDLQWIALSPDGKTIASGSHDLKLWEVDSGKELWTAPKTGQARFLAFTGDGKRLALIGQNNKGFHFYDVSDGKEVATYTIGDKEFDVRAISRDAKRFVSGQFEAKIFEVPTK